MGLKKGYIEELTNQNEVWLSDEQYSKNIVFKWSGYMKRIGEEGPVKCMYCANVDSDKERGRPLWRWRNELRSC